MRIDDVVSLLREMQRLGDLAVAGDYEAQRYLEADAIRVIDGHAEFHRERFLAVLAADLTD